VTTLRATPEADLLTTIAAVLLEHDRLTMHATLLMNRHAPVLPQERAVRPVSASQGSSGTRGQARGERGSDRATATKESK